MPTFNDFKHLKKNVRSGKKQPKSEPTTRPNITLNISGDSSSDYAVTLDDNTTTFNINVPTTLSTGWYKIQLYPGKTIKLQFSENFDSAASYLNFFGFILISGGQNGLNRQYGPGPGGAGGSTLQNTYNNFITNNQVLSFTCGGTNSTTIFNIDDVVESSAGFNTTTAATAYNDYINETLPISGGAGGNPGAGGSTASNWPSDNIFLITSSLQPDYSSSITLNNKFGGGGSAATTERDSWNALGGVGGSMGIGGSGNTTSYDGSPNNVNDVVADGSGGGGPGGQDYDAGSAWFPGNPGYGGYGATYIYFYVSETPIEYSEPEPEPEPDIPVEAEPFELDIVSITSSNSDVSHGISNVLNNDIDTYWDAGLPSSSTEFVYITINITDDSKNIKYVYIKSNESSGRPWGISVFDNTYTNDDTDKIGQISEAQYNSSLPDNSSSGWCVIPCTITNPTTKVIKLWRSYSSGNDGSRFIINELQVWGESEPEPEYDPYIPVEAEPFYPASGYVDPAPVYVNSVNTLIGDIITILEDYLQSDASEN